MALPTKLDLDSRLEAGTQPQPEPPKLGEPGFGKGQKNTRKGSPRAKITEVDATFLAFAGLFPGADSEAFSVLAYRQASPQYPAGELPSMSSVETRLRKLRKLGALESYRHAATGITSYSLTKEGFGYARSYGYRMDSGRTLNGITVERLTHFRLIGHVAAQLISPSGFFEETLGIQPVPIEALANENEMRTAFAPFKEAMKAEKKAGQNPDWGQLRADIAAEALGRAQQGELSWQTLIEEYPALLTLGLAGTAGKQVHQPDLAVKLDTMERQDAGGRNIMVEVELSRKSRPAYDQILKTIKAETELATAYNQAVYFTVGTSVERTLKDLNREHGYGLFETNRLVVLPLLHRDGSPVDLQRRIKL